MSLAIEIPDSLTEQIQARQIPETEIKAVVVAALELWLAQKPAYEGERFTESAVPFVRQLIAQNRELFEALAKR